MSKYHPTTQECEKLLAEGWILKQHKNTFYGHSYYMFDVKNSGIYPQARYINKTIAANLQKKGYKLHTDSRTIGKVKD